MNDWQQQQQQQHRKQNMTSVMIGFFFLCFISLNTLETTNYIKLLNLTYYYYYNATYRMTMTIYEKWMYKINFNHPQQQQQFSQHTHKHTHGHNIVDDIGNDKFVMKKKMHEWMEFLVMKKKIETKNSYKN